MANLKDISSDHGSTCPTHQMSFADVARYIKDGFDEPVQRALSAHIQYCNACQDELEKVRAIMSTGRHLMNSQVFDSDKGSDQNELSEALISAYVDGGLTENEQNLVTQHLSNNYQSYAAFTAIEREVNNPATMAAPDKARELVRAEEPVVLPSLADSVREKLDNLVVAVQQLLALRWPAPALAFAAGVIAMIVIIPATQTIIPVPNAALPATEEGGKIRSGLMDAPAGYSVVTLPEATSGKVKFTWTPVNDVTYRAELMDAETGQVLETVNTVEPEWNLKASIFENGNSYTLFVTASSEDSGVRHIATISIVR